MLRDSLSLCSAELVSGVARCDTHVLTCGFFSSLVVAEAWRGQADEVKYNSRGQISTSTLWRP